MARIDWFKAAKFGLLAHWGVYSAIGRGEWVLNRERMPFDEYRAAAAGFRAERFDPGAWADMAVDAGQKYFILTAKHHDGFCLWDTKTTDWNATKIGPKRDLVGELIEAFHSRGLKIGFFFSLADWSHPDYPTPYANDWPDAWASDTARQNVVEYDIRQIDELCSNYGPIDILWFDGAAPSMNPEAWQSQRIFDLARSRNPDVLINNRLFLPGDFDALELHLDHPPGRAWETDYPLNDSWAWNPRDTNYKSPWTVWHRLITANAAGGNLLLNVSPRADGTIPEPEQRILQTLGARLRRTGHVEYGPELTGLGWLQGGIVTGIGNTVFLHFYYREGTQVAYGGISNRVLRATLVDDGRELAATRDSTGRLRITGLPATAPDDIGHCIRLDLDGPPVGFGVGHRNLNF